MGAVLHARDLVKRILAFSRPVDTDIETVRIDTIVDEALKMLRAVTPISIEFKVHCGADLSIRADSSQIHQVIVGLSTNAINAVGDAEGQITLRTDPVSLSEGRASAQELGIDSILSKPVTRMKLASTIREVLEG